MQTPIEIVKALYAAFGRGDIEFILAHIAEDAVWISPGDGIPASGTYHGRSGAAEFFRKQHESEEITKFEPREFFASGDNVVVLGFEEFRSRATGKTAATNWAMLLRLKGDQVTYFETFFDTASYAQAHKA